MHKDYVTGHILIAGLGRLGAGLAAKLATDGYRLSGIRRTQQPVANVDLYAQDLLTATPIQLPDDAIDLVVIVLTPASRDAAGYRDSFINAPKRLLDAIATKQSLPPVIFVSSTAVFGDLEGYVDERTTPQPERFNGRILLHAEQQIARGAATCVRFAGIYGASNRTQQRALATARGERPLPPAKWMNRIHQQDCIGLLHCLSRRWLIDNNAPSLVVGCNNQPMTNHQLYQQLAAANGLKLRLPEQASPTGKRIESRFIKAGHYQIMQPAKP